MAMRRLIEKDWFWWVSSVTMAGILAFSCIQTIQIANLLYTEYTGYIRHLLFIYWIHDPIQVGIAVSIGTALCSGWLLLRSPSKVSRNTGAIAGVFAVLIAHFIIFVVRDYYLSLVGVWDFPISFDLYSDLWFAPTVGLVWFGWFTLPLGAFVGGLLGWFYTRTHPTPENNKASLTD